MDFRLLGPVEVTHGGRVVAVGGHQQKALLAILVLHANQVVSTDRLIDLMWGEAPPVTARKSLQAYVSRLKSALGDRPSRITAIPPGYILRAEPDEVDALRFESLARRGKSLMADDPGKATAVLRQALELWRGECMGDVADVEGISPDAIRLEELRAQVLEDRLESELAAGWSNDLVGELEGLVAAHPLRERLWGLLMLALYRSGRQAEALRVFQEARRTLGEEVGIEPSADLVSLEERILLQDPGLLVAPHLGPRGGDERGPIRNPFKGLHPFGEEDSRDFFGRAALVAEIVRRLDAGEHFLSVVGPSGCGKSSLVKAGLLPALRAGACQGSQDWLIAEMTPGSHPFVELEAALLRAGSDQPAELVGSLATDKLSILRAVLRTLPTEGARALLVIDQMEELFAAGVAEEQRWDFVRALVIAASDPRGRLRVVACLRGDFYDRALAFPEFAELVTAGLIPVPPLSGTEVEEAVVEPATAVGLTVEPELLTQIATDIAAQPGALPLFQYALTEVFERREGSTLTVDAYRAVGGIHGALTQRADEVYGQLDDEIQEITRQLFLRLVTPGEGTLDVRRRVPLAELTGLGTGADTMQRVIDGFGRYRLITFDREPISGVATVEVAHEALLREWGRLRDWIDASRSELRFHRSMAERTAEWLQSGRHPDYLPTGLRLEQTIGWRRSTSLELTRDEDAFLTAAMSRRDEELADEERRKLHESDLERRSVRRLWAGIGVLAVATVIAVILGVLALNQRGEARDQADTANQQAALAQAATAALLEARNQQIADELTLISGVYTQVDPQVSLHLILHALNVYNTLEQEVPTATVGGLHWALQAANIQYPTADAPTAVLTGPQGHTGVFDLPLDELIEHARGAITRPLTPEECELFFAQGLCPTLPEEFDGTLAAAVLPTASDPALPLAGTGVSVWGAWTGSKGQAIKQALDAIGRDTGITIAYSGSNDLEPVLTGAVARGEAPDLAFLAQPAAVAKLAGEGELVNLGEILDVADLEDRMSPYLLALGTDDVRRLSEGGELYGVFTSVNVKGIIWYPIPEFEEAGYTIPRTWEELLALSHQMVDDGRTPWCMGEEGALASGWPGTDWIESLVLHAGGPELYDQWVAHEIPFTHPVIRDAFEKYGEIVFTDGFVAGGPATVVSTDFSVAMNPMTFNPPGCWLHHQATFMAGLLPQSAEVGTDVWAFPFPTIAEPGRQALLGGGDMVAAFHDRPEVRTVLDRIVAPEFQNQVVVMHPGALLPLRQQDLSVYPDDFRRWQAGLLETALNEDAFRFDGSDLMPPAVGTCAFWHGIIEYLETGPDGLHAVLAELDSTWESSQCQETPG